ncbi:MAG TPA: hypothetical protein DCS31_06790 [Candidatus Competibacteraceae bacterium]|nr:hypothetical protein [Candidatus Competibacteraceae bacterium]
MDKACEIASLLAALDQEIQAGAEALVMDGQAARETIQRYQDEISAKMVMMSRLANTDLIRLLTTPWPPCRSNSFQPGPGRLH